MPKLSPEQRGYGQAHRARRRAVAPMVEADMVRCARCGELIKAGRGTSGTSMEQNGRSTQGRSTDAATGQRACTASSGNGRAAGGPTMSESLRKGPVGYGANVIEPTARSVCLYRPTVCLYARPRLNVDPWDRNALPKECEAAVPRRLTETVEPRELGLRTEDEAVGVTHDLSDVFDFVRVPSPPSDRQIASSPASGPVDSALAAGADVPSSRAAAATSPILFIALLPPSP
jgi:hypothetical protein